MSAKGRWTSFEYGDIRRGIPNVKSFPDSWRKGTDVSHRDWKKLTFYYFAETYVNFNPLVTDLFKIYKTRIWMSAINPASFASPTASSASLAFAPFQAVRERTIDVHSRGASDVQQAPEYNSLPQAANMPLWGDGYDAGITGQQSMHTFGQPFQHQAQVQRFSPHMNAPTTEYRHGGYLPGRGRQPHGHVSYVNTDLTRDPMCSCHEGRAISASSSAYSNPVTSFRNLSLGS